MRAERPLRLPLQIGTSALYSLARGSALAVPGIILFAIGAVVLFEISDVLDSDVGGYVVLILLGPGFVLCGFAYKHLSRARRERPSDIVISPEGGVVFGGPHGGLMLPWPSVQAVRIDAGTKDTSKLANADDSDLRVLIVQMANKEVQLASAERPAEQQSLKELEATLIAASTPPADQSYERAPADRVDQLACKECNAALVPVDAPETKCPYCDHVTPVTDRVRQQVRDAAALAGRPDAQIAKLLDQPRSGSVGAMYLVAAMFMLVAWPAAVFMLAFEYQAHTLTAVRFGFLVGFVLACIAGFYALIRARLVDRAALRLVAIDFAALEPTKPGEPYRCTRCVAPLPDAGAERTVVRCVYCQTDNVLGLHIGRRAAAARDESSSLADALAQRRRERRRWRGVSLVALGLLFVAWWSLRQGIGH